MHVYHGKVRCAGGAGKRLPRVWMGSVEGTVHQVWMESVATTLYCHVHFRFKATPQRLGPLTTMRGDLCRLHHIAGSTHPITA